MPEDEAALTADIIELARRYGRYGVSAIFDAPAGKCCRLERSAAPPVRLDCCIRMLYFRGSAGAWL